MELIEVILSKENLNRAYKKVVSNKGVLASGVHSHILSGVSNQLLSETCEPMD